MPVKPRFTSCHHGEYSLNWFPKKMGKEMKKTLTKGHFHRNNKR